MSDEPAMFLGLVLTRIVMADDVLSREVTDQIKIELSMGAPRALYVT
jgi:hypothetical protein